MLLYYVCYTLLLVFQFFKSFHGEGILAKNFRFPTILPSNSTQKEVLDTDMKAPGLYHHHCVEISLRFCLGFPGIT